MRKKLRVYDGNLLYFIMALMFLFLGNLLRNFKVDYQILITEYLIILLPPIIYTGRKGLNFRQEFRLGGGDLENIVLAIVLSIVIYPIAIFFNLFGMFILSNIGHLIESPVPIANSPEQLFKYLFLVGLTPGICEEIMFRGFILRSFEDLGRKKSIYITAFLFGVFHFNLQNFFGPFILGIYLGYLVYYSGSIYPAIALHAANNSIATIIGYRSNITEASIPDISNIDYLKSMLAIGFIAYLSYRLSRKILLKIGKKTGNLEDEAGSYSFSLRDWLPVGLVLVIFFMIGYRTFIK